MLIIVEPTIVYDWELNRNIRILPLPTHDKYVVDCWYPVGEYVYKYIGTTTRIGNIPNGCIGKVNDKIFINEHDINGKINYALSNLFPQATDDDNFEDIVASYATSFDRGDNIMKNVKNKLVNTGDVYMPELDEHDDPFERIIKLMIREKQIILSNFKANFNEDYVLDNLRSSLDGTTKNMAIHKFILWCNCVLNCDWTFILDNADENVDHPLPESLVISNNQPLECTEEEILNAKEHLEMSPEDDPLKRLVKCAIIKKGVLLKDYRDKGSTIHLLNNMRSSLKGKTKMTVPYFINWCEVLDLVYDISIQDRETGKIFRSVMI